LYPQLFRGPAARVYSVAGTVTVVCGAVAPSVVVAVVNVKTVRVLVEVGTVVRNVVIELTMVVVDAVDMAVMMVVGDGPRKQLQAWEAREMATCLISDGVSWS
jgi:hypothetical protein